MTRDLTALLESATPEPQRLLNPEELLRAARHRVTVRRRAGGGLGAALVAVAATAALLFPSGGHQSPGAIGGIATPAVSALETTSPLPAAVTRALAQAPYISTGRGTLVHQLSGGEQVYLVPVNAGQLICIVDLVGAKENSMTCAPRSGLLSSGVYLTTQLNETSPAQALIVAPDGYTTATAGTTTVTVADNLAVLRPLTSGTVILSGPRRPSVTLHVGPFGFRPATAKGAQSAPKSGTVPLVTTGPCAGLTVVSYIPTGAATAPANAWRISPGTAGNRITMPGNSLLYFRASGPCATQLRYLPHTPNIQGPSGTEVPFSFVDNIGFIVTHSTTTTQTATVDLLLGCTAQGCGAAATTTATVTVTITPSVAAGPATALPSPNPSQAVPSASGAGAPPGNPSTATVPDVIGLAPHDATPALAAAGFTMAVVDETLATTVSPGHVALQVPVAGSTARKSDTVTVTVQQAVGTPAPTGVTDSAASQLRTLALAAAAQEGDPSPSLISAVYAAPTSTQQATFVIAIRGTFTCLLCKDRTRTPGSSTAAPVTTGASVSTVATLVLDAKTYATVSGSLGNTWPDLALYGAVRDLTRPARSGQTETASAPPGVPAPTQLAIGQRSSTPHRTRIGQASGLGCAATPVLTSLDGGRLSP